MPMFYTPKPRQFKYRPRFYDPEKERWEALKQKYADEHRAAAEPAESTDNADNADLEYFQRRVRELDRSERGKLTWKDAFRKREMPTWNYQPRFASTEEEGTGEHIAHFKKRGMSIKRRFDVSDTDYMKPVPAGRIMLYALLVCALLYWILF
jgi:hypothetical protein